MEESENKVCPNCKREIPSVNFTIHTVHCARNIKLCPVCKEPVPQHELNEHHEKLHKLMPCKKCGESVCGTDLEDHIRDSCGHTIKSCRFCELELPRHELPLHEGYCGVRTEQCPDCNEYVMIKYRQLHLDSNHGFLRLDDDPVPQPKKYLAKINNNPIRDMLASSSNGVRPANGLRTTADGRIPRLGNTGINGDRNSNSRVGNGGGDSRSAGGQASLPPSQAINNVNNDLANGSVEASSSTPRLAKRDNTQPQINHNHGSTSRGAVKKRPAPKPPANRMRDLQYYSAVNRQEIEERERQLQSAYNAAIGLPPVLSPAAKLEKLRKMDALHNRETERSERVQRSPRPRNDLPVARVRTNEESIQPSLSDLEPMTPAEFMMRFERMQLEDERPRSNGDRFSEIKSSLRELRRGLNEVTAPYNNGSNNSQNDRNVSPSPSSPEVSLPCEFCGELVPAANLVLHQTGCRPDLTQYRAVPPAAPVTDPYENPVIPCEFCTESLPVYLITEHQERCRRDGNLLFPD